MDRDFTCIYRPGACGRPCGGLDFPWLHRYVRWPKGGLVERRKKKWSGRLDLNQRPHAPQACALPGCATSRLSASNCGCCSPRLQTRGFSFILAENPRLLRGELQHRTGPSAYHSDSRTVNNERSESRRSSNVLRSSAKEGCARCASGIASSPFEPFGSAAWSRKWRRAPAIVNPSS
jgi:hypothetical protein